MLMTKRKGVLLLKINYKLIIYFLSIFAGFSLNAQNITVSGKVQDSLQTPLDYANILAVPENDSYLYN